MGVREAERAACELSELELRVWMLARAALQSSKIGVGPFSPASAAETLGKPLPKVRAALEGVCRRLDWYFDAQSRFLLIPHALPCVWDGSPAQLTGYRRELTALAPPSEIVRRFEAVVDDMQRSSEVTPPEEQTTPQRSGGTSPQTSPETTPQTSGEEVQVQVQVLVQDSYSKKEKESDSPESVVALWNTITTPPIPRCRELTPTRRKHAAARLRERGAGWLRDLFLRIEASPFLRGSDGWTATIDWALKPANALKILEGNYDARAGQTSTPPGRTGTSAVSAYAEHELRECDETAEVAS